MNFENKDQPIVEVDGFIEKGREFDLEITLPEDNRTVIYGLVKDCHGEPVRDAVVKLVEVVFECGEKERKPVSHTFTDKNGEFVFGPLCPDRCYEVIIWVNRVRHFKICEVSNREGKCLKGVDIDCCEEKKECEKCKCEDKCEDKCREKCEEKCEDKCRDKCEEKCEEKCEDKCDNKHNNKCNPWR